ncbi:MAG TPA: sigma-70 family RNA polymerase sigma factor, partial [Bacillota bacterium]|nr:sigma-70 family RNA polymerase sigma factor [Bacillota bacterium]
MSPNAPTDSLCATTEPRPTPQDLWKRYHQGGDRSSEGALIERYLPLVRSALGRLAMNLPEHVDHDDLNSAGMIGLLQALRNFDPACGSPFEAYARQRVRGAMLDELRRMDWVPRTVHEKARRIQEAIAQLEQKLGRIPTDGEVARALNLSATEYEELLAEIRPATFVCLDAVCASEDSDASSLCEVVGDQAEDG